MNGITLNGTQIQFVNTLPATGKENILYVQKLGVNSGIYIWDSVLNNWISLTSLYA